MIRSAPYLHDVVHYFAQLVNEGWFWHGGWCISWHRRLLDPCHGLPAGNFPEAEYPGILIAIMHHLTFPEIEPYNNKNYSYYHHSHRCSSLPRIKLVQNLFSTRRLLLWISTRRPSQQTALIAIKLLSFKLNDSGAVSLFTQRFRQ